MLAYRIVVKAGGLYNLIFTDFSGKINGESGDNKLHITIIYFQSDKF